MRLELPPPINRDQPENATLKKALAEQWEREAGHGPDGYLEREAPPTPKERLTRNLEVLGIVVQQN